MIYLVSVKLPVEIAEQLNVVNQSICRKPSYPFHFTLAKLDSAELGDLRGLPSPGLIETCGLVDFKPGIAGLLIKNTASLRKTHDAVLDKAGSADAGQYAREKYRPHISTAFEHVDEKYLSALAAMHIAFTPKTYSVARAKRTRGDIVLEWEDISEFSFA